MIISISLFQFILSLSFPTPLPSFHTPSNLAQIPYAKRADAILEISITFVQHITIELILLRQSSLLWAVPDTLVLLWRPLHLW